jgi:hypothetical protein
VDHRAHRRHPGGAFREPLSSDSSPGSASLPLKGR